ncbi:MAG: PHP domain-containing protein, partial [Planctomycetaceae bacterium]|nr:PHP domain-containing protein [Planctomycetaceae bacterium]
MPEQPPSRTRPSPQASIVPCRIPAAAGLPYAELHCRTNYSFLEGASHPDELVETAASLGYQALAVTDRNSLAGVVRAHVAAKEHGLKLLIGAEITPVDGPVMVLLATSRHGYGCLSELITTGRRRAPKGECRLQLNDLRSGTDDLICCVPLSLETQLRYSQQFRPGVSCELPTEQLQRVARLFPNRCHALAELHFGPRDARRLDGWVRQCREARIPLVAANDVHYHTSRRRPLHDVLTSIRLNSPLQNLGHQLFPNGERCLKSIAELRHVFRGHDQLLRRTVEIADQCQFSLDELKYEYPEELIPDGCSGIDYLKSLVREGVKKRFPNGLPEKIAQLIRHELQLIEELHYEAYFLTVYDLVRFARERDILCQGRGSAANSVVCYCLGITSVDPARIDVLFERFISRERNEAPDIDVDFEHERREEVLQYLFQRYGRDRAGMTATVITYRPRSAIRDIGRAIGLSNDRIEKLSTGMERIDHAEQLSDRLQEGGIDQTSRTGRQILDLMNALLGFPRHL